MAKPASCVLMIRPAAFGYNSETAANNAFQNVPSQSGDITQLHALQEFDQMVELIRAAGIEVVVVQDRVEDQTPDSIFPNNWFSTFGNELILYSMFALNRRRERKTDIVDLLKLKSGKEINDELLELEHQGHILEGTGSLVCDHEYKIAYAAISDRTNHKALDRFEQISGYKTVRFRANGPDGQAIYHTNVMMCIAENYAVIGLECIESVDREKVRQALYSADKAIIELSNSQVFESFAGNMLQLCNEDGKKFILMSQRAKNSLSQEQLKTIEDKYQNTIIAPAIPTIENVGGGSVRCMLGEIFRK
ncbi:MAG: amidinotransferase [Bacteroidia bacterium]